MQLYDLSGGVLTTDGTFELFAQCAPPLAMRRDGRTTLGAEGDDFFDGLPDFREEVVSRGLEKLAVSGAADEVKY